MRSDGTCEGWHVPAQPSVLRPVVDAAPGPAVFGVVGEERVGEVEHLVDARIRDAVQDGAVLAAGLDKSRTSAGRPSGWRSWAAAGRAVRRARQRRARPRRGAAQGCGCAKGLPKPRKYLATRSLAAGDSGRTETAGRSDGHPWGAPVAARGRRSVAPSRGIPMAAVSAGDRHADVRTARELASTSSRKQARMLYSLALLPGTTSRRTGSRPLLLDESSALQRPARARAHCPVGRVPTAPRAMRPRRAPLLH